LLDGWAFSVSLMEFDFLGPLETVLKKRWWHHLDRFKRGSR
jgi:hypothetical protein